MKKVILVLIIAIAVVCLGLTGCQDPDLGNLSIVCTVFPEYDWTRNIVGDISADYLEITLLSENGVDLHNYQPTVKDLAAISTCDLFIYNGGESDGWVDDALKNAVNKDRVVLNLMDSMQSSLVEEEEAHNGETAPEAEEETEYDEHIWLSLKNAVTACNLIRDAVISIDEVNKDAYTQNAKTYTDAITALDGEYQTAVDSAPFDTLLFGDRFPFLYMVKDYNLNYFAAFSGCSAESEASFATFSFLQGKLLEYEFPALCKIDGSTLTICEDIITMAKTSPYNLSYTPAIVTFDSLQSVKKTDIDNGKTYLSTMAQNLVSLKTALGVTGEGATE